MAKAMTSTLAQSAKATPAPYLPFRTFLSSIEALEHGVPKEIDRTIWRSQSGMVQSQILMALRFFNLVDDEDQPTDLLHEVVDSKDDRPVVVGKLLTIAYADLLVHDLTKTTPKMLEDAMEQYSVTGETKRKAVAFFLKAAKYAGFPMHPLLSSQVRNTGPRKKRANKRSLDSTITVIPNGSESGVVARNTKSIRLSSGGTITLSLSYDPFALSAEDRKFVFELVDSLKAYADSNPPDDEHEEGAPE
ncbi:MAG TPA: DUF5343 domain-containing protein [Terriglobales bacterium]|jgi:hypothetical protein